MSVITNFKPGNMYTFIPETHCKSVESFVVECIARTDKTCVFQSFDERPTTILSNEKPSSDHRLKIRSYANGDEYVQHSGWICSSRFHIPNYLR